MRVEKNVFKAGKPLKPGDLLMTGERHLKEILWEIAQGNNVSVIGARRIGKTTLMNFIMDPDQRKKYGYDEPDRRWLALDLQLDVSMTPEKFAKECQKQGFDKLGNISDETELFTCLPEAVDSAPIALNIDEFDKAMETTVFTVRGLNSLRSASIHNNMALIFFSKSRINHICKREFYSTQSLSDNENSSIDFVELSTFFNNFKVIKIPPVPLFDFSNWLKEKGIPNAWHGLIYKEAGPSPYFLQLLCDAIYWTSDGEFKEGDEIEISPAAFEKFRDTAMGHYEEGVSVLNNRAIEILVGYAKEEKGFSITANIDIQIGESLIDRCLLLKEKKEAKGIMYKVFSNQLKEFILGRYV